MHGLKNEGTEISSLEQPGMHIPQSSNINFAVPNKASIRDFKSGIDLPVEIPPGIIETAMSLREGEQTSFILSVDGKKVAPGLTDEWGDIDLFGHEKGPSLKELITRKEAELRYIEDAIGITSSQASSVMHDGPSFTNFSAYKNLCKTVNILSVRLKDLRKLDVTLNNSMVKFRKLGGDDWKNSKYVYAISSIQASQYQLREVVTKLLKVIDDIMEAGADMCMSGDYVKSGEVDPSFQQNWIRLKPPAELPPSCIKPQYTQQRSDEWFKLRTESPVTGSTVYVVLGASTLKEQQKHFDKVKRDIVEHTVTPKDLQDRFDYDTDNEVNAIATLTGKILPFYYPSLTYVEDGCHRVYINQEPLMIVSPDGLLSH